MASVIGEQSLGWFASENACEEPDIRLLVGTFSGLLYRVAFSILRNPAEAEDVVQETVLRVVQHQGRLSAIRDLRPWLVRIAWNLALDRRRRVQPEQMDDVFAAGLASPDRPADQTLAQGRHMDAVLSALERLPKLEREVLLLSAIEELATAEIAVILNRSESSVRSLIFRARAHLKQRLDKPESPRRRHKARSGR